MVVPPVSTALLSKIEREGRRLAACLLGYQAFGTSSGRLTEVQLDLGPSGEAASGRLAASTLLVTAAGLSHLALLCTEECGGSDGRAQGRRHHNAALAASLHALDTQLKAWVCVQDVGQQEEDGSDHKACAAYA